MRITRAAIAMLVVAFYFCMIPTPARADEGANDPPMEANEQLDEPGAVYFDYKRLKLHTDKTIEFGHCYSEFSIGGGLTTTLDKGDEFSSSAYFGFGQARSRFVSVNLAKPVTLQMGVGLTIEGSTFSSSQYEGDNVRTGACLEMAFLHNSKNPLMSLILRPGVSFDHSTGASRVSSYKLNFQDSLLWDTEIIFEFYGLFMKNGEYRAWRNQRISTGFFPVVQVQSKLTVQLSDSRHASFPGPSDDNTAWQLQLIPYIYRGAWEQGIIQGAPIIGFRLHEANGYVSERRGTTIVDFQIGATATIQLHKHVYFGANVLMPIETQTGRVMLSAGGYITADIW